MEDVAELVRLRGVMYHGMGVDDSNDEWIEVTTRKLTSELARASIVGGVVERVSQPGLCGAGLIRLDEVLGSPRFPKGLVGHVGSVAVDPEWRRRGIGESILRFLIDEARRRGVERVELHATPDGESIYRRLGFRDRQGGVELRLDLSARR